MKKNVLAVLAAMNLALCCVLAQAQTASAKVSVSASTVEFGDHDLGTITPADKPLIVINANDAPVALLFKLSGTNPGDFSIKSTCPNSLPARGRCEIIVLFSPLMTTEKDKVLPTPIERSATLEVKGDNENSQVSLKGKAFQNIGASRFVLDVETQQGSSLNATHPLQITNYTDSQVDSLAVTVTGDFFEDHSGCVKIGPGNSCVMYVTFSPKESHDSRGALAFTGTLAGLPTGTTDMSTYRRLTRGVALKGGRSSDCNFWGGDCGTWLLFAMAGSYFVGLVLVRWHMIAKPARAQIVAQIESVRARVIAETDCLPKSKNNVVRSQEINRLLDQAVYPFLHRRFFKSKKSESEQEKHEEDSPVAPPYPWWWTRAFNALFWTRGSELSGWSLAHEAELELVELLPLERVRARLEVAEQELRALDDPVALALADRLHQSLTSGEALIHERVRELLQQFQLLLRPLSVPEAARKAWLADLRLREAQFLQNLLDWISKNTTPFTSVDDCKTRLLQFVNLADSNQWILDEANQLAALPDLPAPSKAFLERVASFITQELKTAIQTIQQQSSGSTLTLNSCNSLLNSLGKLGSHASLLLADLKESASEAATAYRDLSTLCKTQGRVVAAMTQATTDNPQLAVLRAILDSLGKESVVVQKLNEANASGGTVDQGRDWMRALAATAPLSDELMRRVDSVLNEGIPTPLVRWRALLGEALGLIYWNVDNTFSQLAGWHNKLMWLVSCALLFLLGLGLTFENRILLLAGAVGGLLSRLQRTIDSAEATSDYGATWGALFLSPLTGALTAWGGILLIIMGLKFGLLGPALGLDWKDPSDPTALAIALLFGFSERWFSGIAGQLESKVVQVPSGTPASSSNSLAPTIAAIDPNRAILGREETHTVHGANFKSGAKATVTDETGKMVPAKLEFKDATTVLVTFTPVGAKAYTTTLTISNLDKLAANVKLDVTASK